MSLDLHQLATARVAGIPAWAAFGVVGVGLGLYYRHHGANAGGGTPGPVDDSAALTGPSGGAVGGSGGGGGGLTSDTFDPGTVQASTNQEWLSLGVRVLVGAGYDGPTAQAALEHYVTGGPITSAELAMVSIVMGTIGSVPQAIPLGHQVTNPPPAAGVPPRKPPGSHALPAKPLTHRFSPALHPVDIATAPGTHRYFDYAHNRWYRHAVDATHR